MQKQIFISSKLASIGELAAGIAHEINNPLAIINGYREMISSSCEKLNTNDQGLGEAIKEQGLAVNRIKNIVDGLRLFAMNRYN